MLVSSQEHNHSNWAVIIAGSQGYYNYRHQSDISHAYHILVEEGGFPKENVITFMFNDIAYKFRKFLFSHFSQNFNFFKKKII